MSPIKECNEKILDLIQQKLFNELENVKPEEWKQIEDATLFILAGYFHKIYDLGFEDGKRIGEKE